jgi:hypothetical protein
VVNGYFNERILPDKISRKLPFDKAPFPRMIFALEELQQEHGWLTAYNPQRKNRKETAYFVRLLSSMQHTGIFSLDHSINEKEEIKKNFQQKLPFPLKNNYPKLQSNNNINSRNNIVYLDEEEEVDRR